MMNDSHPHRRCLARGGGILCHLTPPDTRATRVIHSPLVGAYFERPGREGTRSVPGQGPGRERREGKEDCLPAPVGQASHPTTHRSATVRRSERLARTTQTVASVVKRRHDSEVRKKQLSGKGR